MRYSAVAHRSLLATLLIIYTHHASWEAIRIFNLSLYSYASLYQTLYRKAFAELFYALETNVLTVRTKQTAHTFVLLIIPMWHANYISVYSNGICK